MGDGNDINPTAGNATRSTTGHATRSDTGSARPDPCVIIDSTGAIIGQIDGVAALPALHSSDVEATGCIVPCGPRANIKTNGGDKVDIRFSFWAGGIRRPCR